MLKPPGTEKMALCRISDVVKNFENPENKSEFNLDTPPIQRSINREHVENLYQQLVVMK